jgi:glycosyltransferase involved in cell wall biosynthesis
VPLANPNPAVLLIYGDLSGCTLYRTFWPVTALRRQHQYPVWHMVREHKDLADVMLRVDAVVLCRLSWKHADYQQAFEFIDKLHLMGKAVIYESDDDLFSPDCLPQISLMDPRKQDYLALDRERRDRIDALGLCDGVTVSTPRLATLVREYTRRPVHVVPNSIAYSDFRRVCASAPPPWPDDTVTIGWAGGKRLDTDLEAMAAAWRFIANHYPQTRFVIAGHLAEPLLDAVPEDRRRCIAWQPPQRFPLVYRGIDIGCAPLADVPFNRTKSTVKALEFGAIGSALVYSPTIYGKTLEDGVDGLEASTAGEWADALSRLVEDRPYRLRLAAHWRGRVRREFSLTTNAWRWPAAWAAIVQDYHKRGAATRLWTPAGAR